MIEDDDSFVQQEGLDVQDDADRPAGTRRLLICLVVFILWTLWTTICFLVFRGSMESALEESGVLPLLSAIQEQEEAAGSPTREEKTEEEETEEKETKEKETER